jgi:hypothetical protein
MRLPGPRGAGGGGAAFSGGHLGVTWGCQAKDRRAQTRPRVATRCAESWALPQERSPCLWSRARRHIVCIAVRVPRQPFQSARPLRGEVGGRRSEKAPGPVRVHEGGREVLFCRAESPGERPRLRGPRTGGALLLATSSALPATPSASFAPSSRPPTSAVELFASRGQTFACPDALFAPRVRAFAWLGGAFAWAGERTVPAG